MLTPLAVSLAKRFRLSTAALSLTVIWIANLASLPLPVSNLTNLLALGGGEFDSQRDYITAAQWPAAAAITVAVAASYLVRIAAGRARGTTKPSETPKVERPTGALVVIALTVAGLLSPIPYWATSTVAAAAMALVVRGPGHSGGAGEQSLIPWRALGLTTALSAAATLFVEIGGAQLVAKLVEGASPLQVAATGAVASNLLNNIPAYLALEPAVNGTQATLALLIGVNTGVVITPWASLATLLWADQLHRAGEKAPWPQFVAWGLAVAPAAVAAATCALAAAPLR